MTEHSSVHICDFGARNSWPVQFHCHITASKLCLHLRYCSKLTEINRWHRYNADNFENAVSKLYADNTVMCIYDVTYSEIYGD